MMLLLSVFIKFMLCKLLLKSYIVNWFNKVNNIRSDFLFCVLFLKYYIYISLYGWDGIICVY